MEKSATNEVSITKISIKKEKLNDDIKEFAETAMNELLGWYGYENTRDDLKLTRNCRSHSGSNSSGQESPKFADGCGWCGKSVEENTCLTSAAATFCSELCFSQSRRASFKKNKTCDWCRHVRHTVSYVDFQDGASQLQFCSDKCLNQYKMHIFCRETRAHLELHPHLHVEDSASGTLITPELWMKNCKSPEIRTPSPSISPKPPEKPPQTSPLPLISVTHPSKLMSPQEPESKRNRLKGQRKIKKRLPSTVTCNNFLKGPPNDSPQDLRVRHTPTELENRVGTAESPKTSQNEKSESHFRPVAPPIDRLPNPQYFSPSHPPPPPQPPLRKLFDSILPPPTIIVPYPIILPLPIPIPIPIPIPSPIKKEETKVIDKRTVAMQTETPEQEDATNSTQNEIDVVGLDKKEVEEEEIVKKVGRPLRKRKRTCEPKGRAIVKTRKVISASSN